MVMNYNLYLPYTNSRRRHLIPLKLCTEYLEKASVAIRSKSRHLCIIPDDSSQCRLLKMLWIIFFVTGNFCYRLISFGIMSSAFLAKPFENLNNTDDDFLQYYKHNDEIKNNSTELRLEKVNWTVLDIKTILSVFPFLENLTVHYSNITDVIPPSPNNQIKVRRIFVP